MNLFHKVLLYKNKLLGPYIRVTLAIFTVLANIASILMLLGVVYEYGFVMTAEDIRNLHVLYHWVWVIYLIYISVNFALDFDNFKKRYKHLTFLLSALLYLTLVPVLFHDPGDHGIAANIWGFFHHEAYGMTIMALFSLLNLSDALVRLLGKRTNPSLILAVSFLVIILIGTGLLLLPLSTLPGVKLAWVDALFTSTSAVCVTGLTTVDVPTTFSTMGLVIIILLIQIGGLGIMTLTSFFALFFMGNTSIYNQLVVRDMVSSKSLNSLLSTLLYILFFTLFIELIGALLIWGSIHGTLDMTIKEEIGFSIFHSISAFCNAGFSTLPNNLGYYKLMTDHNWFYIIISLLILLGGIGFPILVNFKEIIAYNLKQFWQSLQTRNQPRHRKRHLYELNTRIVLIMTFILTVFGTLLILYFEWDVSFAGMSTADKWTQAFFNAVCPRTAGFNSVNLSALTMQSVLIYLILMWIGGGAQSTAGGIKMNAFAAVVLNMHAVLRGSDKVNIFGRQISQDSIRRSNTTVVMYLGILFVAVFLLSIWQPEMSIIAITFECISAISTVGSSLDNTALLVFESKLLVCVLMFVGRVGLITMVLGIIKQKKFVNYSYPKDDITIN